jgi:hypothetical protein
MVLRSLLNTKLVSQEMKLHSAAALLLEEGHSADYN